MVARVSFNRKSGNRKTGPIPVSTTERSSCPNTCPFKDTDCYGEDWPLQLHWNKLSEGKRGMEWDEFCAEVETLPDGQLWRHNQAGDLPHAAGQIILRALEMLIRANKGKRGFTFCHHVLNRHNVAALAMANAGGFTVNASTETREAADAAIRHGLPAVIALPEDAPARMETPEGNTILICPAQRSKTVTCQSCGWCARKDRGFIVGFWAHGKARKRLSARLRQLRLPFEGVQQK